jgi:hypothetical protein
MRAASWLGFRRSLAPFGLRLPIFISECGFGGN